MEVINVSPQGIEGRYRKTKSPNQNWVNLNFIAPNLVTYRSSISNLIGGSALYSLPLGKGRCRIIIKNYKNSATWKLKLKPRWFEHWYRSKFLEEDLPLVMGQQNQVGIGSRFERHTKICGSCSQAYEVTKKVRKTLVGVAISLAALALVLDYSWIQILVVFASVSAVLLAVVAEMAKTKFERSSTRN